MTDKEFADVSMRYQLDQEQAEAFLARKIKNLIGTGECKTEEEARQHPEFIEMRDRLYEKVDRRDEQRRELAIEQAKAETVKATTESETEKEKEKWGFWKIFLTALAPILAALGALIAALADLFD